MGLVLDATSLQSRQAETEEEERYAFGAFEVTASARQLSCAGQRLKLRRKCFVLLLYLLRNAHRVVPKRELVEVLWPSTSVHENSLAVAVRALREALQNAPQPLVASPIETVVGYGYRFRAEALRDAHPAVTQHNYSDPSRCFVGREEEERTLASAFQQALAGRGSLVLLSGEAGIGKSALVEHFLKTALDSATNLGHSPVVLRGQCLQLFGACEPLLPFIDSVGELLASRQSPAVDCFARYAPQWAALFPGRETPAVHGTTTTRPTVTTLSHQYIETMRRISALQPTLLVLEDLHWADDASLDLLQRLSSQASRHPLLLLGTLRAAQARSTNPGAAALLRRGYASETGRVLELPALSRAQLGQYLQMRLGAAWSSPQHATELWERTEGLPLFVDRLVPSFVNSFVGSSQSQLHAQASKGDERALPRSLVELIAEQLQRLTPEQRDVLECGAVLGRRFDCALLAAAAQLSEIDCEQRLDELTRGHDLVQRDGEDCALGRRSTRFAFRHVLVRDQVYERLTTQRRITLHLALARALEARCIAENHCALLEVAIHYEQACEYERAVLTLLRTGELCERRWLQDQAFSHFSRAMRLLHHVNGPTGVAASFMLAQARGWTHNANGEFAAARECFAEARKQLMSLGRAANAPQSRLTLDAIFAHLGTPWTDHATQQRRVTLERHAQADLNELVAETYHAECAALSNEQQFGSLLHCAEQMSHIAEQTGNQWRACEGRCWHALALLELGRLDESELALRRALELTERLSHRRTRVLLHLSFARLLLWRTQPEQAHEHCEQAQQSVLGAYDSSATSWLMGDVLARLAKLDAAVAAHARAQQVQARATGRSAFNLSGWIVRCAGDLAQARSLDEQALALLGRGHLQHRARVRRSLALTYATLGDEQRAKEQLLHLAQGGEQQHFTVSQIALDARCALAYCDARYDTTRTLAERWLAEADELGMQESRLRAHCWLWHAAWRSGEFDRAGQHLHSIQGALKARPIPLLVAQLASPVRRFTAGAPPGQALPLLPLN